ncbi:MAE_28990/MAE_18760 family HEPN-like nuclease, partial [Candidatus Parabeggiatoa sp. HSG14]|uniref:MAE_28990/MAE_18760 family HEPN-like nuclease n=1 Tax=Candidatus Parabeggiatoa sp. HSG14 TaxID=3055593 RepID=UPI0025A69EC0|nr:MAE_28990/MAE_18760 family HEPN-like nuclease [Thiotrichales bacterium HSG14]
WNTAQKEAASMVEKVANKTVIQLGKEAIPLSGNLDAKEIRRICELHKISYAVTPDAKGGFHLLTVKNQRNVLSHGNIAFTDCGHKFTIQRLEEIKNEVIIFIRCILNNMKDYANNKQYAFSPLSS